MVNFIVVTHGEFGAYLIEAAEAIVGEQPEGVRTISISPRHTVDEVRRRFEEALAEVRSPEGVVVAVDMPGGTPTNVALPPCRGDAGVEIVSGLNLYMLVTGFTRRGEAGAGEVARRMVEAGQRSIQDLRSAFAAGRR